MFVLVLFLSVCVLFWRWPLSRLMWSLYPAVHVGDIQRWKTGTRRDDQIRTSTCSSSGRIVRASGNPAVSCVIVISASLWQDAAARGKVAGRHDPLPSHLLHHQPDQGMAGLLWFESHNGQHQQGLLLMGMVSCSTRREVREPPAHESYAAEMVGSWAMATLSVGMCQLGLRP